MKLTELRSMIGSVEGRQHKEQIFCSKSSVGIPLGAITEIIGAGKTELIIQYLADNPQLKAAWIESQLTVYPCAIYQRQARLNQILFVETKEHFKWVILQALRSQLFQVIIAQFPFPNEATSPARRSNARQHEHLLRKLQLASEKAQASLVLLSNQSQPQQAWPIGLQIQAWRNSDHLQSLDVRVLKSRVKNNI